jgi:hypothetical protein
MISACSLLQKRKHQLAVSHQNESTSESPTNVGKHKTSGCSSDMGKNKDGSLLMHRGNNTKMAELIMGVNITKIKVDQLRMMCTFWGFKNSRQANRVGLSLLIAKNQLIGDALSKSELAFNEKKTLVQASKFWLLNVFFSVEYFE